MFLSLLYWFALYLGALKTQATGMALCVECVIEVLRSPEGLLLSWLSLAFTELKTAHHGTPTLQPNCPPAGERSVFSSQVAQIGMFMLPLPAIRPSDKAAQSKDCKWSGWASDRAWTESLAGCQLTPFYAYWHFLKAKTTEVFEMEPRCITFFL